MLDNKQKSIFTHPVVLVLGALLCCALWGSASPFIKLGSAQMIPNIPEIKVASTILFAGIRFTGAGILTVLMYSIARRKFLVPKVRNIPRILTVSAFQTVIQYIFFYIGLANTSSVKGTITSGLSGFFCVLIASLIFKQEKLTLRKIIACVLGFAGIIVVNLNGLDSSFVFIGDGFVLISAISLAFSSVLMKIFSKHEEPVLISGYQFIIGGIFMILIGIIFGGRITIPDFGAVAILIYLSALSAVAYALWGVLLKHNPVSRVTIFNFSTPFFGTVLSILLLSEDAGTGPINIIATLLLVSAGIFLLNFQPKKKDK
ncbi:MAG: DMT family transporter [Clostridia bacterium]|nr:DMT family transporter [Clostridia bacterium]